MNYTQLVAVGAMFGMILGAYDYILCKIWKNPKEMSEIERATILELPVVVLCVATLIYLKTIDFGNLTLSFLIELTIVAIAVSTFSALTHVTRFLMKKSNSDNKQT